jgi:hypothetical protein
MRVATVNFFMISSWFIFDKNLRTSGMLVKAGAVILKENRPVGRNQK